MINARSRRCRRSTGRRSRAGFPSPRPSPLGRGGKASPCSIWPLTPALSQGERGKSESALYLAPHPGPLPRGEGERRVRALSGPSPRPSPQGRGGKASPCSIRSLSLRERVRVRVKSPHHSKSAPLLAITFLYHQNDFLRVRASVPLPASSRSTYTKP